MNSEPPFLLFSLLPAIVALVLRTRAKSTKARFRRSVYSVLCGLFAAGAALLILSATVQLSSNPVGFFGLIAALLWAYASQVKPVTSRRSRNANGLDPAIPKPVISRGFAFTLGLLAAIVALYIVVGVEIWRRS